MRMEWLDPWWSTEARAKAFHETFRKQLELEVPPGHVLFGLPVKLIGRGNGDDALFEILDGTGRVAVVHLTWAKKQERLPFPGTEIFENIEAFYERRIRPEHEEWKNAQG